MLYGHVSAATGKKRKLLCATKMSMSNADGFLNLEKISVMDVAETVFVTMSEVGARQQQSVPEPCRA